MEKLEKKVPEGAVELMQVRASGPRTAYKLSKDYGVKSMAQLKEGLGDGEADGRARRGDRRRGSSSRSRR